MYIIRHGAKTIFCMKKLRSCICLTAILLLLAASFAPQLFASANADAETPSYAYVGGFPIGISIDVGGLLVEDVTGVETEYGTVFADGLQKGDIIKKIDGNVVNNADDLGGDLGGTVRLDIIRGGTEMTLDVTPIAELYSGKRRLGVRVKDKVFGIGSMTYVDENGKFAALGHEIFDSDTNTHIPFSGGNLHDCKIVGIKRGNKNEAGAILATLMSDSLSGNITCNNNFGIAGTYDGSDYGELLPIASRDEVKQGKAQIRTTVEDIPEYYDVEIIKASGKSGRHEKSMVIRVTDKRLLKKTGGIVRGMSGSPIIQNGKIVGAVTHVFMNDFTKGYGLYADSLNAA